MNTLEIMGIAQTARCRKQLTAKQFSEINAENSRLKGEQDCLRGLEPQEKNPVYLNAYGAMYERLEHCAYLGRII